MTLLHFPLELDIKTFKEQKQNDFTIKIFIAKRGSILSSPLFMSKKNAFMLDFVNINRTFACVAKKNIQKTYKIR